MVGNTTVSATGEKDIPLKSTCNEKVRASVCLTAKAGGTKVKAFVVLQSAKQEKTALNENFKHCCVVVSSNGWMNETLTLLY